MRAYLPVSLSAVAQLLATAVLHGPRPAWVVDPQWRAGAPQADEEEWEYLAASLAAEAVVAPGLVLAVEAEHGGPISDGATTLAGPIALRDVASALTADLAWYGLQELPALLAELQP